MVFAHGHISTDLSWATFSTTVVLAAATVAAAIAAWRATSAGRKAAQGQLLLALLDRYSTGEMADALKTVRRWFQDYPTDPVEHWQSDMEREEGAPSDLAREVDASRRLISHYFLTVARLARSGHLDDSGLRMAASEQSGMRIMFPFVWQLECSRPGGEPDQGEILRWLAGKAGADLNLPPEDAEVDQ